MNKYELIQKLFDRLEDIKSNLRMIPEEAQISHVVGGTIFFDDNTYKANMELLHDIRKLRPDPLELSAYYMSCERLCLSYRSTEYYELSFYCTDVENALQRASSGKCSIQETSRIETVKTVICNR